MEAEEMIGMIIEALYVYDEESEEDIINTINTYESEGLLTNDKGIVVRLKDQKSVFHITVTERES